MEWHVTSTHTSPLGQRVEYVQQYGGGTSEAEGRAKIRVSGKTVKSGWSADGKTYEAFSKIVKEGWKG